MTASEVVGLRFWMPEDVVNSSWEGVERCGLVVQMGPDPVTGSPGGEWVFVETPNSHPDPDEHFFIEPHWLGEVVGSLLWRVEGVWHSHPPDAPEPSQNDMEGHPWWLDMYIVCAGSVARYTNAKDMSEKGEIPW